MLDVYERLYSNGEIGPLILVIPSLTSDDGRVHGLGIDHLKPWIGPQAGGTGTGLWEQYLVHDVIPFVDSHWRTLASGEHRGVDGFSIGGAVAAKVAAKLPGVFRTVGAYDGTFFFSSADGTSVCPDDSILTNPIWDPAFGAPRDLAHATANSPANLILHANRAALQRITWMVQYGRECIEPNGSNYYRGRHLTRALRKRGIENSLAEEVLQDGDHTWRTADRHMAMTLAAHWHVLRRTA